MKEIKKKLNSIYGDANAWKAFDNQITKIKPTKIFILLDENTKACCFNLFLTKMSLEQQINPLIIPSGENHKTIDTCLQLWNELSEKGADRDSLLINLGGGVITDLGGFVACTFKRGIHFINIPTSLLAMVDASVGGKNGVDLGSLKNQVGVIKNPLQVIIDTSFLKTLPKAHITSGLAEMLKHGLIYSETYWNELKNFTLENNAESTDLIWKSVEIKNEIVTEDPFEKGRRKTLNYGHTLGHAIESYCMENSEKEASKKELLHGEAVAIGLILATYISSKLCNFPKNKLKTITEVIISQFEKVHFSKDDIDEIIKLLIYDKKNKGGKIYFVLLTDIGDFKINCTVENSLIYDAFNYYENF